MKEKNYKLVIDLICPACSKENCVEHIPSRLMKDQKSGLEAEAICVCKNH